MNYKITFYNEFEEIVGIRTYEDVYYQSLCRVKFQVIDEINKANITDLIMTDNGAVRKSQIGHFNIEEC